MNNIFFGKVFKITSPYQLNQNSSNQNITEHFFDGKKDTTETTDINRSKENKEITTEISKDMMVNSVSNLVAVAVNEASTKNQAEITKALVASNKIRVAGAKGKIFKVSGITQEAKVESKTEGEIVQKVANIMSNDISNSITKNIKQATSDIKKLKESVKENEQSGTDVGEAVGKALDSFDNLTNQAAGTVNNLVDNLFGGETTVRTTKITETEKNLKEIFNLSEDFKVDDEDILNNELSNILSNENLANCAEQSATENSLDLQNLDFETVELTDIKQSAVVSSAMKCAFNQEVLNELSNKLVNQLDKTFEKISESLEEQEKTKDVSKQKGDLLAMGNAVGGIITATGDAVSESAKGLGEGVSTAAKGAGEGVSTAAKGAGEGIATGAKGVGEGASNILNAMILPLVVITVLALIVGVAYYMFRDDFR